MYICFPKPLGDFLIHAFITNLLAVHLLSISSGNTQPCQGHPQIGIASDPHTHLYDLLDLSQHHDASNYKLIKPVLVDASESDAIISMMSSI